MDTKKVKGIVTIIALVLLLALIIVIIACFTNCFRSDPNSFYITLNDGTTVTGYRTGVKIKNGSRIRVNNFGQSFSVDIYAYCTSANDFDFVKNYSEGQSETGHWSDFDSPTAPTWNSSFDLSGGTGSFTVNYNPLDSIMKSYLETQGVTSVDLPEDMNWNADRFRMCIKSGFDEINILFSLWDSRISSKGVTIEPGSIVF